MPSVIQQHLDNLDPQEQLSILRIAVMILACRDYCQPAGDKKEQESALQEAALRLYAAGPMPEWLLTGVMTYATPMLWSAYRYGEAFITDPSDPATFFDRLKLAAVHFQHREEYQQPILKELKGQAMPVEAPEPVTIDGVKYEMRPLKLADFQEAESASFKVGPNPLDIAIGRIKDLPDDRLKSELLKCGWEQAIRGEHWLPRRDVISWLTENHTGRLFSFWCWIRQAQPDITYERAVELQTRLVIQEAAEPQNGAPQTDNSTTNDGG